MSVRPQAKAYRRLVSAALALVAVVVVFGAYVRLSDAGLGCPDWPGCYGQLSPEHAAGHIEAAAAAQPGGPVSLPKAWKEMIHRYLAATLGLLIIAVAVLAWRRRGADEAVPGAALGLVAVVVFQGLLGMWTVTLLLKPAIVTAHLLGGMSLLALLAWLRLRAGGIERVAATAGVRAAAALGLTLLLAQIALGGWTSTNYAALACGGFPTCNGQWWPLADYADAFHLVRELGMTADGALLPFGALVAIHWVHRLGAAVVGVVLLALGARLARDGATRAGGLVLIGLVVLQIGLGIANVMLSRPLALAVAHSAGAALLLATLVWINYRLAPRMVRAPGGVKGIRPARA